MRHAGFREMILLVKHGVPWELARNWSFARRSAALQILEDDSFSRMRDMAELLCQIR